MSATIDMPPPASKGRAVRNRVTDIAPDPNVNRAADYPNQWRIEHNKQTAKCMVCGNRQAGTKWCVACENCNKRMCSPCWKGERFNLYGEAIFEGKAQNDEGCWCRFPSKTDLSYRDAFEARSQRTRAAIAAEAALQAQDGGSQDDVHQAKRQKLVHHEVLEVEQPAVRGRRSDYPQVLQSADDWNARRRSSAEDSVQQNASTAPPRNTRSNLKERHVHDKTTIIVGAGVIGLSIARELAARTYQTATNHQILVVEQRAKPGEGASSHCAGLITKHGVPEVYGPLLELSLKCWNEQLANEDFRDIVHFVPNRVVHVKSRAEGRSDQPVRPPEWYNIQPEDVFKTYGSDVGKISTSHLTDALFEQCLDMDVKFRLGQEIKRIEKSMRGQLQAVDIGSSIAGNVNEINVPCHNIIVAAGAQTPEALDDIVTWLDPKMTFENHKQSYEWVRVPVGDAFDGEELEDVSLVVRGSNNNNLAGKGKAKANDKPASSSSFSILTAEPETNTILAATIGKPAPTHHFTPVPGVDMDYVRENNFSQAEKIARTYIQGGKTAIPIAASAAAAPPLSNTKNDNGEMHIDFTLPLTSLQAETGSATISTSFSHRPLIDMIPWHIVDPRVKDTVKTQEEDNDENDGDEGGDDDDDEDGDGNATDNKDNADTVDANSFRRLGIYVVYGFGRHGTTLAPGVARVVASKVFGGKGAGVDGKKEMEGEKDVDDEGGVGAVGKAYAWPKGSDGGGGID